MWVGVCCGCCPSWLLNSRGTSYRVWETALVKTEKHQRINEINQWPLQIKCYRKQLIILHFCIISHLRSLPEQQQFCCILFKVVFVLLFSDCTYNTVCMQRLYRSRYYDTCSVDSFVDYNGSNLIWFASCLQCKDCIKHCMKLQNMTTVQRTENLSIAFIKEQIRQRRNKIK